MSLPLYRFYPLLAGLALPFLTWGQEAAYEPEDAGQEMADSQAAPEVDPPERVARLSYISGDVTFQAADGQAPEKALINRPFTIGDRLMTGVGRSELTMGTAAVRLDAHTDVSIANLDADVTQIEINSGTISVHVRELENNETVQIDAPNSTVQLLEPGDYRVEIDPQGTVFVDVRAGRAEIDAGSGPVRLNDGQQGRLAPGERLADIRSLGRADDFDNWSMDRERQLNGDSREASRYVGREVVGYEDLDDNGDWADEPEYGSVWYPHVAVGWAPYQFGSWAWISPWGWTWIDYEPWGFAPFHYGRWAYVSHRSRWCWVPGPRHYRPVYAPALVGWVGNPHRGGGISVSIGTGIGWFPLGPREVYVPYRRTSPRYLRNVNVSNTVIVNNTYITNVAHNRVTNIRYMNRNAPGAVTTMPRHEFDAHRPPAGREWRTGRNRNDNGANGNGRGRTDDRPGRANGANPVGSSFNGGGRARIGSPNANPSRNVDRDEDRRRTVPPRTTDRPAPQQQTHPPRQQPDRPQITERPRNEQRYSRPPPRELPQTNDRSQDSPRDTGPQKGNHAYRVPDRDIRPNPANTNPGSSTLRVEPRRVPPPDRLPESTGRPRNDRPPMERAPVERRAVERPPERRPSERAPVQRERPAEKPPESRQPRANGAVPVQPPRRDDNNNDRRRGDDGNRSRNR